MKVHEAAKQLGVTPRTLRFYEEKGLIKPHKESINGYRTYSDDDLLRLRWIISLRELGMSVSAIIDALNSMEDTEVFIRKIDGARASLYEEWVSATEALKALDETMSAWQCKGLVSLSQAEQAAGQMKQNRILRTSWSDYWNYDGMALRYGYHAPLVTLDGLLTEEQYNYALIRTVDWLDPGHDEQGLELGAGSGNLTVLLSVSGTKLTVVEQSVEMLAIMKDRLPQVDAKQGNMLALPLGSKNFSFIVCSFAMHHLNHSQQLLALEEMDRVLLSGGRMVITGLMIESLNDKDKNKDNLAYERNSDKSLNQAADSSQHADSLQENLFTPSSLEQLTYWLETHQYSTVTEKLNDHTWLLFAAKS